jgi:hypothetical protein
MSVIHVIIVRSRMKMRRRKRNRGRKKLRTEIKSLMWFPKVTQYRPLKHKIISEFLCISC